MQSSLADLEHDRWGRKTIFHVLMGVVILAAGNILASLPVDLFFSFTKAQPVEPFSSIFTYTLKSKSDLITGGAFGIESSLPAVIGYGAVIFIILTLNRKNKRTETHSVDRLSDKQTGK